MEMEMKKWMNEIGGAFAVTWLIAGITVWNDADNMLMGVSLVGAGMASLGGMLALGVVWMAFRGADILPIVTWMKMMTGDMSDVEGNWMANGITLVMQIVGGVLALVLMGQLEPSAVTYAQAFPTGQAAWEFDATAMMGLVAVGAILGHISTKVDNDWAMPIAVMTMAGLVNFEGAMDMASMLVNTAFDDLAAVAIPWILDGVVVGIGALIAMKIDEALDADAADASAEQNQSITLESSA